MSRLRLSARLVTCALVTLTSLLPACDRPADPAPSNQETPIAAQIAAVERGESSVIHIEQATITDADLNSISRLASLTDLLIPQVAASEDNLSKLAALPHLENLRIGGAGVTDASLRSIARCKSLRYLIIEHAPVTDAGLAHLQQIETLESLYLIDTKATDAGVEALKQGLPDLHVHW